MRRTWDRRPAREQVVEVADPTGDPGVGAGVVEHLHAEAGGAAGDAGMIAFWEIHDSEIGDEFPVDINTTAGLPWWVNHIAFGATDLDDTEPDQD